jgi:hypothetical protein
LPVDDKGAAGHDKGVVDPAVKKQQFSRNPMKPPLSVMLGRAYVAYVAQIISL